MPATIRDELRSLESLTANPRNYNRHDNPQQVARMMERMRHNAFTAPLIIRPDGTILGGHLRRLALLQLRAAAYPEPQGVLPGWQVPCRVFEGNEAQELSILVGDNPDPQEIDFDNEGLTALLAELQQAGALAGSGYDDARLESLLDELANTAQPTEGEWGAALGDLPEGDKAPFQQMTFTLADAQAETVREAMEAAKDAGPFEGTGNENSNGNALARICEAYLNAHG